MRGVNEVALLTKQETRCRPNVTTVTVPFVQLGCLLVVATRTADADHFCAFLLLCPQALTRLSLCADPNADRDAMGGIRGRKSNEKRSVVNAVLPKEYNAVTKRFETIDPAAASTSVCDDKPVRSAEETAADMQQIAAQAAAEAEAARVALAEAPKEMKAKARRKLEAVAAAKAKEAKRLAIYVQVAQHQAPPEQLKLFASSLDLGSRARKESRRHEQAAKQVGSRSNRGRDREARRDGRRDDRSHSRSRSRDPESDDMVE